MKNLILFVCIVLFACKNRTEKVIPVQIFISLTEPPATNIKQTQDELFFASLPGFVSVHYVPKEDALRNFVRETGEDVTRVLNSNPLPDSYTLTIDASRITTNEYSQLKDQIRQGIPHCREITLPDIDMVRRANN